jgi:hypothetical protein
VFFKAWIIKEGYISREYRQPIIIICLKVYFPHLEHQIAAVLTVAKDVILPDIKSHMTFYLHLYAHDI